jgi:hypothetical protein
MLEIITKIHTKITDSGTGYANQNNAAPNEDISVKTINQNLWLNFISICLPIKGAKQAIITAEIDIDHPHKMEAFSAFPTIALSKYAENIKVITTVANGELAQSYKQYAT